MRIQLNQDLQMVASIQAVFDAVITGKLYSPAIPDYDAKSSSVYASTYMCNALRNALGTGVITVAQQELAQEAIFLYMQDLGSNALDIEELGGLDDYLAYHGFSGSDAARLAIYSDWLNRPYPD